MTNEEFKQWLLYAVMTETKEAMQAERENELQKATDHVNRADAFQEALHVFGVEVMGPEQ